MNNSAATIQFYGQEILVVVDEKGERWVALRHICEGIGIATFSQQEKVKTDPRFTWHDIMSRDSAGRPQEMFCIPVSQLNGWLFSINANRVKPEVREKLLTYQRECQEVLFRYFMPQGGTNEEVYGLLRNMTADINGIREDYKALQIRMQEGQEELREDLREEFLEGFEGVRETLNMLATPAEQKEIKNLVRETHKKTGMTKLAIIGHVRKTLGTSGVYETANPLQVKNVLRNLLGRGVFGTVTK